MVTILMFLFSLPHSALPYSSAGLKRTSFISPNQLHRQRATSFTNIRFTNEQSPASDYARPSYQKWLPLTASIDSIRTDENETILGDNPLRSAGLSFVSASSKSLGMLFYNIGGMDHKEIQALLLAAGTQLVEAGNAWDEDWDAVRDSMESASKAFYDISNVFGSANIDESMPLALLFEQIGRELEDISSISGCCAVGPPSSAPNLLSVEENLTEISRILKMNSVAATDEHMMCTLFKEVAELFGEMAGRYVDETGQSSEVSL